MFSIDSSEINSITFGVLSPEDIRTMSVVEVHSTKTNENSVYDPKMGPSMASKKCDTCKYNSERCTGHFGHIELNEPIIHPLFDTYVYSYLKCFCFDCHRMLLDKTQLELRGLLKSKGSVRFKKILTVLEKIGICSHCKYTQPKISYSTLEKDKVFTVSYSVKNDDGVKRTISMPLEVDGISRIFDNIIDDDIRLLGMNPAITHPKNMILTVLPVIPPCVRPPVPKDGNMNDDDLTTQYNSIINYNNALKNTEDTTSRVKSLNHLKFRIATLFDNSKGRAKQVNNRPIKGIKERISGKEGVIRSGLSGKRVDMSARSVIGSDTSLRMDEIGISKKIADTLAVPCQVTSFNIKHLTHVVNNDGATWKYDPVHKAQNENSDGRFNLKYAMYHTGTPLMYGDVVIRGKRRFNIKDKPFYLKRGDRVIRNGEELKDLKYSEKKRVKLNIGDTVYRKLQKGDTVLLNRQPTLHSGSMMAMKVVPRREFNQKTITMNLACTSSFNADFDGDEMNIHVPSTIEGRAELEGLSSIRQHIISPQSGSPNIVIVQDSLLGAYTLTLGFEQLEEQQFYNMCVHCPSMTSKYISDKVKHISRVYKELGLSKTLRTSRMGKKRAFHGKGLFSMLLPDDFNYEHQNDADENEPVVKIYKGVLYEGAITKANLGKAKSSLILYLNKEYPKDVVCNFIDNVQFITNQWNLIKGFSVGLGDCIATKKDEIEYEIDKCLVEAEGIEATAQNPAIREIQINAALSNARDIGQKIAKDALGADNNFKKTVISGSKGDYFNIAQITGLLGQQSLNGERVPYQLNQNTRSLPHYKADQSKLTTREKYQSRGFIANSFSNGLTPEEFIFHAMSGRIGVCDTSLRTATSGYSQRRIVKCGEDLKVEYDGTVRDATNSIIQYSYGDEGMDPKQSISVNGVVNSCNISRLAEKLNMKYAVATK